MVVVCVCDPELLSTCSEREKRRFIVCRPRVARPLLRFHCADRAMLQQLDRRPIAGSPAKIDPFAPRFRPSNSVPQAPASLRPGSPLVQAARSQAQLLTPSALRPPSAMGHAEAPPRGTEQQGRLFTGFAIFNDGHRPRLPSGRALPSFSTAILALAVGTGFKRRSCTTSPGSPCTARLAGGWQRNSTHAGRLVDGRISGRRLP